MMVGNISEDSVMIFEVGKYLHKCPILMLLDTIRIMLISQIWHFSEKKINLYKTLLISHGFEIPTYFLTYLQPFPIDLSWKIGYKTCVICVFENMTYPLVGLGLVDVVDVDEHDLKASDIPETILNRFLLKIWIRNMCHVCFWKYDVPTCGIWPGWCCRTSMSMTRRPLSISERHSQLISLEILNVHNIFLIILTKSLSCFH